MTTKTNSLTAAAITLGVNEDLLAAVMPAIKNGREAAPDIHTALIKDLEGTVRTLNEYKGRALAAEELVSDAIILATVIQEVIGRMRAQESGKAFIATVAQDGDKPNYKLLHEAEGKLAALIEKRARLSHRT